MYDSELGVGIASTGIMRKGRTLLQWKEASRNEPSHVEFSWCLNAFTDRAVKVEVGSLFQNFTT